MRFALLGHDQTTMALAAAIVHSHRHRIVWLGEASPPGDWEQIAADAVRDESWESLLEGDRADVVVVAADADELRRAEQLRRLAQVGLPLAVSHPACRSMLVYYELDMIRQETLGLLVPLTPVARRDSVAQFRAALSATDERSLGAIDQIEFARTAHQRSRRQTFDRFVQDAAVMRRLCGEITRVGAMGSMGSESDKSAQANLTVHLDVVDGPPARWTFGPPPLAAGARIAAIAAEGVVTLDMPEGGPWSLSVVRGEQTELRPCEAEEDGPTMLAQIEDAMEHGWATPDWLSASRDVELAEMVELSLRRGRSIDIYNEPYTEQSSFKGWMGVAGCGLLLVGLLAVLCVAVGQLIAKQAGFPEVAAALRHWPYFLLALFAGFLLLQLLRLAIPDTPRDSTPNDTGQVDSTPPSSGENG